MGRNSIVEFSRHGHGHATPRQATLSHGDGTRVRAAYSAECSERGAELLLFTSWPTSRHQTMWMFREYQLGLSETKKTM